MQNVNPHFSPAVENSGAKGKLRLYPEKAPIAQPSNLVNTAQGSLIEHGKNFHVNENRSITGASLDINGGDLTI